MTRVRLVNYLLVFITENWPEGRKLKLLMRSMGYTRHIQESMGNMRKYGTSECHETINQEKKTMNAGSETSSLYGNMLLYKKFPLK